MIALHHDFGTTTRTRNAVVNEYRAFDLAGPLDGCLDDDFPIVLACELDRRGQFIESAHLSNSHTAAGACRLHEEGMPRRLGESPTACECRLPISGPLAIGDDLERTRRQARCEEEPLHMTLVHTGS